MLYSSLGFQACTVCAALEMGFAGLPSSLLNSVRFSALKYPSEPSSHVCCPARQLENSWDLGILRHFRSVLKLLHYKTVFSFPKWNLRLYFFRDFLPKYRFEGVSFYFRIQICLKHRGSFEKTSPISLALVIWVCQPWTTDNMYLFLHDLSQVKVVFISFRACILLLSFPCGSRSTYRKEQVKQTPSLPKISFLPCCKVLWTNVKMRFKSLKWGRECLCHISSTCKHARELFFFWFSIFLTTLGLLK